MSSTNKNQPRQIEYRSLDTLHKLENNPRKITKADLGKLKKSIKDNPDYFEARPLILSNRTGELVILAGNQRYEAAKALGLIEVPTILLEGLTPEREREIIIRDNVSNGEWDMDVLSSEWDIEDLQEWGVEEVKPYKEIVEDEPDEVDEENTYSIVGDIYQLGDHRIFCGSFDDSEKVRQLFGDKKAACTFTDPPYNVAYKSADGKTIQNDDMAHEDFQNFLNRAFECVAENMASGGGCISWMSDVEILTLKNAFDNAGLKFKTVLCWVKSQFTLGGGDFQSAKELAIYGLGEGKYDATMSNETNEAQYACYARNGGKFTDSRKLSNVWFFEKPRASKDHPTMKPIGLCAKGVLAMSEVGDIVFDPFLGSGSTLIACEQTGRKCYGCEIDPKYVDVIRKRYVKFTTGSEDNWQELTPSKNG